VNMNGYKCVACHAIQAVDYKGFLCPSCGSNLDITYDYDAAAGKFGESCIQGPRDLFRFAALLPLKPHRAPFPLRVGGTPLYAVPGMAELVGLEELYLKDETLNPSASLKDRASAIAIGRAMDTGASVVSVASTGNAGSSLACLAAATGVSAVVFVPASAPVVKLTQMLAFGARVLAVQGNYDDAYDLCRAASDEFGWFNRSTGYNAFTREGKKTCAFEIWQDLDGRVPDRVVVPTGDGNILSAIWKGWRDLKAVGLIDRLPKIDCVQSVASAAICETVRQVRAGDQSKVNWSAVVVQEVNSTTIADSISVNRPRDGLAAVKAVIESGGEAVGLKQMIRERRVAADELVVCIVSGSGLKDVANARNIVGEPQVIEPTLEAVRGCQLF
jgi:threonine synthase